MFIIWVFVVIGLLFVWCILETNADIKKRQKEYDRLIEQDEEMKLLAIGGHWTDHNGVAHYDPELERLNQTPERIALRQKKIDEGWAKVKEYEERTKRKGGK